MAEQQREVTERDLDMAVLNVYAVTGQIDRSLEKITTAQAGNLLQLYNLMCPPAHEALQLKQQSWIVRAMIKAGFTFDTTGDRHRAPSWGLHQKDCTVRFNGRPGALVVQRGPQMIVYDRSTIVFGTSVHGALEERQSTVIDCETPFGFPYEIRKIHGEKHYCFRSNGIWMYGAQTTVPYSVATTTICAIHTMLSKAKDVLHEHMA
jgi:hypothetical protein